MAFGCLLSVLVHLDHITGMVKVFMSERWLHFHVQLEEIDVVSTSTQSKGGRLITANGQRDLDLIAARIERNTRDEVDFEEE